MRIVITIDTEAKVFRKEDGTLDRPVVVEVLDQIACHINQTESLLDKYFHYSPTNLEHIALLEYKL